LLWRHELISFSAPAPDPPRYEVAEPVASNGDMEQIVQLEPVSYSPCSAIGTVG